MALTSPHAALDRILSRARYLIFEFDGPICGLTAAMPSQDTADEHRGDPLAVTQETTA